MQVKDLPAINASLNALTFCFLLFGYIAIKRGRQDLHKWTMLIAVSLSIAFLTCYLLYHYYHGATPFPRHDWSRPVYFTILTTHTILAIVNLPAIFFAVYYALTGQFQKHTRITKLLWPSWAYVSITGVLVYFMLYHWFTKT
ncbi:hypothetical protein A946_03580 [Methylacidiphilum kamchatkense Kam1]|uniref:Putative membrane protein n=1 Tax=Methylacidiphilum kamchatkense Kam1 TaxID=1202785 RepID=A0A0C1V5T8_9BACT|nr:DUF420 domain-containing protein [Methylacidiphilum kamchatkense]KIE59110.1 hypothetical protein A946_03580 [Methylacidiphilum kamchatkense Kam1]QDQ42973.1 putative membrane protein [Methylacidiphilum kamchatkense Kam1]